MIEMTVAGIAVDAISKSPIVLLRDPSERRALPIFIGQDQARAIISAMENQTSPRPLTHDLLANVLDDWDIELEKVIIHALRDSTFYAVLVLAQGDTKKEVDARPSDAIALAIRANCSIWAMEEVIGEASIPVNQDADEEERRAFREFLDQVNPADIIEQGRRSSSSSESSGEV